MKINRRTTANEVIITGGIGVGIDETSVTTVASKSILMMMNLIIVFVTAGTAVSAFIVPPPSWRVPTSVTTATTTTTGPTTTACLHLSDPTATSTHFTELRPLSSVASFSDPDVLRNSGLRYLPSKQRQHSQRPRRCRLHRSSLSSTQHTTIGTSEPTDHVRNEYTDIDADLVTATAAATTTEQTLAGPRRPLTEQEKQLWQQRLEEIQQYQDENNGSSYPPKGSSLRYWANCQRREFNKDLMYTYRIELLNSIGFQWSKPKGSPRSRLDWDEMFDRLVEYKERCDDIIVPTNYPEDPQLGTWCWRQDGRYMEGKLDPEQKAKLDSIGFVFGKVISQEDRWNGMYDRLVEYRKKNNSTLVPQYYEEDPELGSWVKNQRNCFNTNDSRTTPQKIERLEAIGFVWNPHEAAWLEMYNRLQEYKHKNGNADVKKRYKKDPKLGRWVSLQRGTYKKGKLSPDRTKKLEEIGFKWSLRSSSAEKAKLQDKLW
mmetsp:Transcript_62784/g.152867  ORF Transcript_62784/g.152867 Transcript_62784/m.152867 type:complete len:487 (+) Transcript_62784:142-1602(+)